MLRDAASAHYVNVCAPKQKQWKHERERLQRWKQIPGRTAQSRVYAEQNQTPRLENWIPLGEEKKAENEI